MRVHIEIAFQFAIHEISILGAQQTQSSAWRASERK